MVRPVGGSPDFQPMGEVNRFEDWPETVKVTYKKLIEYIKMVQDKIAHGNTLTPDEIDKLTDLNAEFLSERKYCDLDDTQKEHLGWAMGLIERAIKTYLNQESDPNYMKNIQDELNQAKKWLDTA